MEGKALHKRLDIRCCHATVHIIVAQPTAALCIRPILHPLTPPSPDTPALHVETTRTSVVWPIPRFFTWP